jgi:hypothetical protein
MTLSDKAYEERKIFLEQLTILSRSELEEIFRIIRRSNDIFSENTNGIFFDVIALKIDTFQKLQEFMSYCLQNRSEQDDRTKEMNAIRSECITTRDIIPNSTGMLIFASTPLEELEC